MYLSNFSSAAAVCLDLLTTGDLVHTEEQQINFMQIKDKRGKRVGLKKNFEVKLDTLLVEDWLRLFKLMASWVDINPLVVSPINLVNHPSS
jgi:hypothetical protein